jgi:hypothetical protein
MKGSESSKVWRRTDVLKYDDEGTGTEGLADEADETTEEADETTDEAEQVDDAFDRYTAVKTEWQAVTVVDPLSGGRDGGSGTVRCWFLLLPMPGSDDNSAKLWIAMRWMLSKNMVDGVFCELL